MKYSIARLDGDVLVYRAAFSVETNEVSLRKVRNGRVITSPLEGIKQAREHEGQDESIVVSRVIENKHNAISNLKSMIQNIIDKVDADEYEIVLSAKAKDVNRRNKIARLMPYKADRPPKPFHYETLRSLLIEEFNATVVEEGEADDYLGAKQSDTSVIVTVDKDLLQIPGHHYDLNSRSFMVASELGELELDANNKLSGHGFKWFCAQCLLGDRVDAIKGIPFIRQTRVAQLLTQLETKEKCWEIVKKEYMENKKVPLDFGLPGEDEEQVRLRYLKEIAQLVWIAHSDDDYYMPNIDGEVII